MAACGAVGDYYVYEEDGEEKSRAILHNDKNIFVHLYNFDGNVSVLTISSKGDEPISGFRIVKSLQSLSANNVRIHSVSRDDTKRILTSNPDSSVLLQVTEVYEPEKPFEQVTEKIDIELFINEKQIKISREFKLKRVTYNQLQAIWAI